MADKQDIPDNQKTIFDWNREGNINKVKLLLKETDSNVKDENVSGLLNVQYYHLVTLNVANDVTTLGL